MCRSLTVIFPKEHTDNQKEKMKKNFARGVQDSYRFVEL